MYVTKVALENIKSHAKSNFEFQRGTTAIIGANGAGKTTIIEAIAWALFDLLDYKKDDFARRGAKKKGVVEVTFESSLDEREYVVHRDTGTAYYVKDPKLKFRVAEKKEEVTRFLRAHLGVEAGTDLEALFRRAIGVPQGTFTAIFLESATERKRAFEKLLKVEEYRQGAEKLLLTSRFVEDEIRAARESIARAEGELSRLEIVDGEFKELKQLENSSRENLTKLEAEVGTRSKTVTEFDAKEKQLAELQSAHEKSRSELSKAEVLISQKKSELDYSLAATEKLKSLKPDYETHAAALVSLKNLESRRSLRDSLRLSQSKLEKEISVLRTEEKALRENLKSARAAGEKISELKTKVAEQEALEKLRDDLRGNLADARAAEKQREGVQRELDAQRTKFKISSAEIKKLEAAIYGAGDFAALSTQENKLATELAKLRATRERDENFRREIRNGFCPILSQKCLNVPEGESLEDYLNRQATVTVSAIAELEKEAKEVSAQLARAREAEKSRAVLEKLRENKIHIEEEGKRLSARADELEKISRQGAETEKALAETETSLKALADPRSRKFALESEAKREAELAQRISSIEKKLAELIREQSMIAKEMEAFAKLDQEWNLAVVLRDKTSVAHREFIAHEAIAKLLSEREKAHEKATAEVSRARDLFEKSAKEFEIAEKEFDRDKHSKEKTNLRESENRTLELKFKLSATEKRAGELARELERLKKTRVAMQKDLVEKERLGKIGEAVDFIRDTLKEAAPRVARNYVFHVSNEANQIFREITGNAERSLKWTEDYSVVLEEGGFERPFGNLSGGEQMAASLSVRLALLKQLSDIRVAFFDEPTVNMDADNRTRLAEQISQVTNFDQLFVISHDDTFESYVDNVLTVE
jgi:exonuclease SbcC